MRAYRNVIDREDIRLPGEAGVIHRAADYYALSGPLSRGLNEQFIKHGPAIVAVSSEIRQVAPEPFLRRNRVWIAG